MTKYFTKMQKTFLAINEKKKLPHNSVLKESSED